MLPVKVGVPLPAALSVLPRERLPKFAVVLLITKLGAVTLTALA